MASAGIAAHDIGMTFAARGTTTTVLDRLSVAITPGSFVTLLGPSGCGKSTLLKILGGILEPTHGQVTIAGKTAAEAVRRKQIGLVLQRPALLPWKTARENVLLLRSIAKKDGEVAKAAADEALDLVGLTHAADRLPHELSGGMAQRVSIARALAMDPSILLMDEPFGALDAITREAMNENLARIWAATGKTIVFVTHSIPEAVFLSDTVHVMAANPGRIVDTVDIDIQRPRTEDTMGIPEFAEYSTHLRERLHPGPRGWRDTVTLAQSRTTEQMETNKSVSIRRFWQRIWPPLLLVVAVIVVWELIIDLLGSMTFVIAKPSEIAAELVTEAEILSRATWITTQEVLWGFLVSIVVGSALALVVVRFRWVERAVYPLIVLFQVVPKVALAPIFILWFGYAMSPKLVLIVVMAFFPITINMVLGLKRTEDDLILLMRSVGSSKNQIMARIQIPNSLPYLFAGMRIGVTLAVIGAVVAEFAGSQNGLGYLIQFASTQLDTPLMFAALVVVSVLGLIFYYLIGLIEVLLRNRFAHLALPAE